MLIQSIYKEYRDQLFLSGMTMKVFQRSCNTKDEENHCHIEVRSVEQALLIKLAFMM